MMRAKKSLGQNFLSNPKILDKIITTAKIVPGETVLEVGPGGGTLTAKLLEAGACVIAVEKDDRLIPILQKKFEREIQNGKMKVIHGDILDIDLGLMIPDSSYKLIGNIPYYITGILIRKFLTGHHQPTRIVFILQKEVAERIVARDGKESLLSISVKAYGEPRYIETVKAGNFSPVPKVNSAIISIENISKKNFAGVSEEKFFTTLKTGFAHKRKMLRSNLGTTAEIIAQCGIAEKARPEELSVENWRCLAKNLK